MQETSAIVNVVVREEFVREVTAERVEAYLEKFLPRMWYTRKDIKFMTNKKSDDWIRENIDNHPYVIKHGLAFPDNDSQRAAMNYTRGIIDFLEKFGLLKNKEVLE